MVEERLMKRNPSIAKRYIIYREWRNVERDRRSSIKSVMDGMEQWQEGGRLYLYREQLEAGISYLRPITPAHSTLQAQMASVVTNILAGGDPAELLHDAAEYVDEIIVENDWSIE